MLVLALKFSSSHGRRRSRLVRGKTKDAARKGDVACLFTGSKRSQKTEQRDYPNVGDSASGRTSLGLTEARNTSMTSDQRGSR
jgi:hypothetical protein